MELMNEALIIMSLGMGVTFAFLALVIGAVNLTAKVVHRIEGPPQEEPPASAAAGTPSNRARRVAAIAAALHDRDANP
jgi:sodium pump decarboxylase gamma subunit